MLGMKIEDWEEILPKYTTTCEELVKRDFRPGECNLRGSCHPSKCPFCDGAWECTLDSLDSLSVSYLAREYLSIGRVYYTIEGEIYEAY